MSLPASTSTSPFLASPSTTPAAAPMAAAVVASTEGEGVTAEPEDTRPRLPTWPYGATGGGPCEPLDLLAPEGRGISASLARPSLEWLDMPASSEGDPGASVSELLRALSAVASAAAFSAAASSSFFNCGGRRRQRAQSLDKGAEAGFTDGKQLGSVHQRNRSAFHSIGYGTCIALACFLKR